MNILRGRLRVFLCAAAFAWDLLLPVAGKAGSIDLHYFSTSGPGGFINPSVLVGFNPQPEPPGDAVGLNTQSDPSGFQHDPPEPDLNLSDPTHPTLTQPGEGTFSILFGIHGPSGDPVTFHLPDGDPILREGHGYHNFFATIGEQAFRVSFDIGGYTGGWAGFNPQPEPPGDFGGPNSVGFLFTGDPSLTVTLEAGNGGIDDFSSAGLYAFTEVSSPVPEPGSLGLVGLGVAGIVCSRRRYRYRPE